MVVCSCCSVHSSVQLGAVPVSSQLPLYELIFRVLFVVTVFVFFGALSKLMANVWGLLPL